MEGHSADGAITTPGKFEEEKIPFMKVTSNTSIITSAGQTVYMYCQVENLGDRQVCPILASN